MTSDVASATTPQPASAPPCFLVRDCDARVSPAEADLVWRWIDGGYPYRRADAALLRRRGPTAKYGHDQRLLGLMLWPLIRSRCLVHDKYYRLEGVHTVPLTDPQSRFGAGHQNTTAVLQEVERLGIPRVL